MQFWILRILPLAQVEDNDYIFEEMNTFNYSRLVVLDISQTEREREEEEKKTGNFI